MSAYLDSLYEKRDFLQQERDRWPTSSPHYPIVADRVIRELQSLAIMIDAAERLEMRHECAEMRRALSQVVVTDDDRLPFGTERPAIDRLHFYKWSWFAISNENASIPVRYCAWCGIQLFISKNWTEYRSDEMGKDVQSWINFEHVY